MTQQWRTLTIRINNTTRRNVGIQGRFPITPAEWNQLIEKLEELKFELVEWSTDESTQ